MLLHTTLVTPTLWTIPENFINTLFSVFDGIPLRLVYRWLCLKLLGEEGCHYNIIFTMTANEATTSAVALKLPNFWTMQPEIWFTQAEAQINIRGITSDDTKYYYVVAALDQDTAARSPSILYSTHP